MSKPVDIPQEAWLSALSTQRELIGNRADCISLSDFDENTETIARAILSAEKRGEEREREACAVIAEGGSATFVFQTAWAEMRDAEAGNMSARRNVAAAIRKRGA